MQFNNRNVASIVMHEGIHIPAIGQIGTTIAVGSQESKLHGVKLKYFDGSVVMELKGKTYLIPETNCRIIALAPETVASAEVTSGTVNLTATHTGSLPNLQALANQPVGSGSAGGTAVNPHLSALAKAKAANPADVKV